MARIKVVKEGSGILGGYEASFGKISFRHPNREFAIKGLKSILAEMKGWHK